MLRELFEQNRSYRRFYEDRTIKTEVLEGLLANARIANSAGNKQPLKYIISNNRKINEDIFQPCPGQPTLKTGMARREVKDLQPI